VFLARPRQYLLRANEPRKERLRVWSGASYIVDVILADNSLRIVTPRRQNKLKKACPSTSDTRHCLMF